MALIKTDPSQTKTVIALIGILVVAVGVTVVRIKPEPAAQGQAQQQAAAAPAAARESAGPDRVRLDRSRSPFERPKSFGAVTQAGVSGPGGAGLLADELFQGLRSPGTARVEPMDIGVKLPPGAPTGSGHGEPRAQAASKGSRELPDISAVPSGSSEAPPTFVLLATAKSSKGFSAVIRGTDSTPRVVQTGDVLEGGFKVTMITANHVVLSDGRGVAIAKRPS